MVSFSESSSVSSSESTGEEGAGDPPAKRQKHEETGNGNESNVTACWMATDAYTGIPLDNQSTLYSEVCDDLGTALAHRYDNWLKNNPAQVKWFSFGQVTFMYTVLDSMYPCTFAKQYVSRSGTVLWIHTTYDKRKMRHIHNDTQVIHLNRLNINRPVTVMSVSYTHLTLPTIYSV